MSPARQSGATLMRWLVIGAFAAGLAWLLIGEHRVHALGWLPFGLLLLCPLMHIFMHGGHGGHGRHVHEADAGDAKSARSSRS